MKFELVHAITHRFRLTKQTSRQSQQPNCDQGTSAMIAQGAHP